MCDRSGRETGLLDGIAAGNRDEPPANTAMEQTTICLINQKGGCGKSSTCFHLAGAYALQGFRVLLVDADPQGSLSQGFLGSAYVENLPLEQTLAAVFDDECGFLDFQSLLHPTEFERITIIPTNQNLAPHNMPVPENQGLKQYAVRELLDAFPDYDIVLIDCPPNLYLCSWASMVAADYVVIPVPPEDFGTQGLRTVHQAVENVRKLNPAIRRLGHLVTRYDARLLVHQSYHEKLRTLYKDQVLTTVVSEASAFKVSLACRKPVSFYSPRSPAARQMDELGRELLERIAARTGRKDFGKTAVA